MRNFACWRVDDAYSIINPDADALPDHVFRAVHTSAPLQTRERHQGSATIVDPETLLRRFLAPRDHVLVPVVGQSGTGKSHLIRWMRIRLPPTPTREVIFVPKAQTNLRDIVRTLADLLPSSEKEQVLAQLQGAGDSLSGPQAQRTAILNELHTGLQNDAGDPQSGIDHETEAYLLEGLRAVFNDHHLRGHHFLRDESFAADLAAHVFERPDQYRPAEQRRTFGVADLPLDIGGIERSGYDAQQFLLFLVAADDPLKDAAASIVNRHVDRAISRCLNITGDRLIDLMLGIRRRIGKEGKSLVLLIEDFARLQGLDRALLQSLIEQRNDLCVLRTAFACTTGFYETVAETVRTRLTFVVDMDIPLGAEGASIDLARFTGRYMNALRHGEAALAAGLQAYTGGEEDFTVSNRCAPCPHQSLCHETFGEADGFGLYPFTPRALEIMADRADPEARQRFNTRTFQKSVLRPIALAAPMIEAGQFPDPDILSRLGGVQGFSPMEQRKLELADPGQWKRRQVLLQLWEGSAKAANLPEDLQGAFGLERINLPDAAPVLPSPGAQPQGQKPSGDPIIQALVDWNNEQLPLSQQAANDLRPLLFRAIDEAIDWDSEGLSQTDFRGPGQAFRPESLYFQNQTTNRKAALVSLTIPAQWDDRDKRYQTVMALQGLREAKIAGSWTFPGSAEKLACLLECLARWSKEVVRQIREVDSAQAGWDPVAAALAVRVSIALVTSAEVSTSSNLNVIRAAIGPLGSVADFEHPGLRSLVAEARKADTDLLAIIAARRSAMKGGAKGDYVDTAVMLEDITGIRRSGFIPEAPPPHLEPKPAALQRLLKITARLSAELRPALQQEAALRRAWLSEMEAAFGPNIRQADIVTGANELTNLLGRLGLPAAEMGVAKSAFQQCAYDALVSAVRRLPAPGAEKPGDVAQKSEAVIQTSRKLLRAMEVALQRAEPELEARLHLAGIDPDAERTMVAEIDTALVDISIGLAEDQHADVA